MAKSTEKLSPDSKSDDEQEDVEQDKFADYNLDYLSDTHKLGQMASEYNAQVMQDVDNLNLTTMIKQEKEINLTKEKQTQQTGQNGTEVKFSPESPIQPNK